MADTIVAPGANLATAIRVVDHWCPHEGEEPTFGNRKAAHSLLHVEYLQEQKGLTGEGVNVVVVDYGLNKDRLGASFGGGWKARGVVPGTTKLKAGQAHGGHGMLVAMNILAIAPDVGIFDLPMVPPEGISDIGEFFERATGEFEAMLDDIKTGKRPGPWIIVNAWAVFDRASDPQGKYTNDPAHPFNRLMDRTVREGHDVVFGAGNCGAFCAHPRCGPGDQGPGNSIFGANSHPEVLTVGAVRSDTTWLGYSSQGPGQTKLAREKPDLCAPSEFVENLDATTANTGTSTACALAAGVIACLRARWPRVPPRELKSILNETATDAGGGWNGMTGHGILNARTAFDELERRSPTAESKSARPRVSVAAGKRAN